MWKIIFKWSISGTHDLNIQAGVRYDHTSVVGDIFSPRVNASIDLIPNLLSLQGGYGIAAKMPSLLYLYPVNGNSYNTYTRATLSNYNLEEDRLLIKYSTKMHGAGIVVKTVVPKWVLSPPKDGWKQFPPDINWKGAELDTAYMKKMNIEIP